MCSSLISFSPIEYSFVEASLTESNYVIKKIAVDAISLHFLFFRYAPQTLPESE